MKNYITRHLVLGLLTTTVLLTSCSSTKKWAQPSEDDGGTPGANAGLTRNEAQARAHQIGNVSYSLWFGLQAAEQTDIKDYTGRAVISFDLKAKAEKHGREIHIDFLGGRVDSLMINGVGVTTSPAGPHGAVSADRYDGRRIMLKLAELKPGSNRIEIAYTHPFSTSGSGLHRFTDPVDQKTYLYTDFEPFDANQAFPCFDQPDLKASFELTVDAPKEWTVISNTLERDVAKVDGRKAWSFPPSPIFSTYVFALHAGPYASWKADANGIPMRLFARQSLKNYVDSPEWFRITRAGLEFFSTQFAYQYPYGKYDQLIVPEFNSGAMENVAAVTFSERTLFRGRVTNEERRGRAETILHEMAHMWFGNLVTMKWWNGLWLNESFATLSAAWASHHLSHGETEAESYDVPAFLKPAWQAFFTHDKQWAYYEDQLVTTHPIEVPVPDTEHATSQFDGITYGKGASVLKQLVHYVGEDSFKDGMQRYFEKYSKRNTTLADFMKKIDEASDKNLAPWQKEWLQTTGVNTVRAEWTCDDEKKREGDVEIPTGRRRLAKLELVQSGAPLRTHATRVGAVIPDRKDRLPEPLALNETLDLTYAGERTTAKRFEQNGCPLFVFPNMDDHDYVKVELDPVSLNYALANLSKFADPFLRQMLWHTLWQMVLDVKLKPQIYFDTFTQHITAEKDIGVLQEVLSTIHTPRGNGKTVTNYVTGTKRDEILKAYEKFARSQLGKSPAGSDQQLVWFKAWIGIAHTADAIGELVRINKTKGLSAPGIPGLHLDQERRWDVLNALARASAEGKVDKIEDLLAAEYDHDKTDNGLGRLTTAQAMIPKPESKQSWIARLDQFAATGKEPQGLGQSKLRGVLRGFHPFGQEDLSRAAMSAYFNVLSKWTGQSVTQIDPVFIRAFTSDFAPPLCESAMVDRLGDAINARGEKPTAMVKALLVVRQELERCMKIRAYSASAN